MKLTKRSFNRRIYVFGILMFTGIASVSTGFAAWVMSKNVAQNQEGAISVGTITDGSIEIKNLAFKDNNKNFLFEPAKNDIAGDIKWDGTVSESLSVTITGTVTPKQYLQELTIKMNTLPTGIQAAINKKYLTAPTCYSNDTQIEVTASGEKDATFSYTISFGWGDEFEKQNPSVNLDNRVKKDNQGNPILDSNQQTIPYYTYAEKLAKLVDFKRTIYELPLHDEAKPDTKNTDEEVMAYTPNAANTLKYSVVITAKANV